MSPARRHHATYLGLACAVLAASVALRVTTPTTVGLVVAGRELRLPPSCPMQAVSDVGCPGCGLTRGFVSLVHGDLAAALAFHPLTPLLFLLVAWQVPYRLWMLRRDADAPPPRLGTLHTWVGRATIVALIGLWLGRVLLRGP